MAYISNDTITGVFEDLKKRSGFDDVKLNFHGPSKSLHFSASMVDGQSFVHAPKGIYTTAGIQYLKATNDPIYQSTQKVFGNKPSDKQILQFIMGHEFGHIDHFKKGIAFDDVGNSSMLKDRSAYKATGQEKWADDFAEKMFKPPVPTPSSSKKKKTAGQHRDFDVTARVNEVKQRGGDSAPREVKPVPPKEKVSGESVKKLDNVSSQEVVQQQQKKSNDLAREEARIKAEMDSTKVAQNSESNSKITVSDVEREKIKLQQEESMRQASEKRIKGWGMKGKGLLGVGIGAFALASVMDTSQTLSEKKSVSRMTEEQEENLKKKASKEQKNQRQNAYGHTDMGDIVTEMWNNRIGHHKMGNSKFQ